MSPLIPQPNGAFVSATTVEQNKAIYRNFIQTIFNEGRVEKLADFVGPDYKLNDAPPDTPKGSAAIAQVVVMFQTGFADLKITLEELVAEGELLAARATTEGTHTGEFLGMPATGKKIMMRGLTMVRIKDGLVRESWVKNDMMGLMNQLKS